MSKTNSVANTDLEQGDEEAVFDHIVVKQLLNNSFSDRTALPERLNGKKLGTKIIGGRPTFLDFNDMIMDSGKTIVNTMSDQRVSETKSEAKKEMQIENTVDLNNISDDLEIIATNRLRLSFNILENGINPPQQGINLRRVPVLGRGLDYMLPVEDENPNNTIPSVAPGLFPDFENIYKLSDEYQYLEKLKEKRENRKPSEIYQELFHSIYASAEVYEEITSFFNRAFVWHSGEKNAFILPQKKGQRHDAYPKSRTTRHRPHIINLMISIERLITPEESEKGKSADSDLPPFFVEYTLEDLKRFITLPDGMNRDSPRDYKKFLYQKMVEAADKWYTVVICHAHATKEELNALNTTSAARKLADSMAGQRAGGSVWHQKGGDGGLTFASLKTTACVVSQIGGAAFRGYQEYERHKAVSAAINQTGYLVTDVMNTVLHNAYGGLDTFTNGPGIKGALDSEFGGIGNFRPEFTNVNRFLSGEEVVAGDDQLAIDAGLGNSEIAVTDAGLVGRTDINTDTIAEGLDSVAALPRPPVQPRTGFTPDDLNRRSHDENAKAIRDHLDGTLEKIDNILTGGGNELAVSDRALSNVGVIKTFIKRQMDNISGAAIDKIISMKDIITTQFYRFFNIIRNFVTAVYLDVKKMVQNVKKEFIEKITKNIRDSDAYRALTDTQGSELLRKVQGLIGAWIGGGTMSYGQRLANDIRLNYGLITNEYKEKSLLWDQKKNSIINTFRLFLTNINKFMIRGFKIFNDFAIKNTQIAGGSWVANTLILGTASCSGMNFLKNLIEHKATDFILSGISAAGGFISVAMASRYDSKFLQIDSGIKENMKKINQAAQQMKRDKTQRISQNATNVTEQLALPAPSMVNTEQIQIGRGKRKKKSKKKLRKKHKKKITKKLRKRKNKRKTRRKNKLRRKKRKTKKRKRR